MFFGWWIVIVGGIINLWGMGFQVYGFSVLFKPLSAELGFSRAVTAVAAGIGRLEGGFEAAAAGWLTDKFGPRWVMFFGLFVFGLGLVLMHFVNSLWTFYVVWGVIVGTGMNLGLTAPVDKAIANWFVKKRGKAVSIRWMFSGAASVVMVPLATWFVTNLGWRMACVIVGLGILFVGLPLGWFFIRGQRPEYYGLLPDGAAVEAGLKEDAGRMIDRGVKYAAEVQEVEFTLRQAMRTPAYWLLVVTQLCSGATTSIVLMHTIPMLTDMGMSSAQAAATVAATSSLGLVLRFAFGLVADRVNKEFLRFLYGVAFLLQAIGIAIFVINPIIAMVYPFLVLYFIGMGASLVLIQLVEGRYFGRKAFSSIRGSITMFGMPVGIFGPIFAGWVYDTTGNYVIAFTTLAALLTLATVLMFLTRPPKPPAVVTDVRQFI